MPRIIPILPLLLAIPLRAAAQDGLESRNEAFLRAMALTRAQNDSGAAFFPRRGDWTWTQVTQGAPPWHRPTVWRFPAPETLRTVLRSDPVCKAFSGFLNYLGDELMMRIEADGTRWRRVAGNRFVPPGESARSPMFVQWRREDGRWVVSAFGNGTYWRPRVLGYVRDPGRDHGVPDTLLPLPPTPVYAAETPWYLDSRTIYFDGRSYTKYGLPRAIADSVSLRRVGRFGLIGVYVYGEKRNTVPTLLYIPLAPGQYQLYAVGHHRGMSPFGCS
jgi:hypothetical protein